MKRLTHIVTAAVVAAGLLLTTGCSGQSDSNTIAPAPSSRVSEVKLALPTDVQNGPVSIKPVDNGQLLPYLQLSSRGEYGCKDGMTLLVLNLSEDRRHDASGWHTTTTYNRVKFELNLSDGYYWLSYPPMTMELRAAVINGKMGYTMPTHAWHDNPASNSVDASLELRDVPTGKVSSFHICLVEAAPTE